MPETTPSPSPLAGRRIVLGVTGGIAAYKAVEVCRRLVDAGAHVAPIMTEGAQRFVGEVTFSALASEPVQTSLWDEDSPIPHTRLGQGADLIVVCPATARLLGAYAAGISDDLLTATLLATRAPVVVCPAMHTEMWEHPAVQDNLRMLAGRGVTIVPPEEGRLAGGDVGAGRLAEPERIVGRARGGPRPRRPGRPRRAGHRRRHPGAHRPRPLHRQPLLGQAGPRPGRRGRRPGRQGHPGHHRRPPGRRPASRSSGSPPRPRWRTPCASAATGPTSSSWPPRWPTSVPTSRPTPRSRRTAARRAVTLVPTPDILGGLLTRRWPGQTLVGFAAETDDVEANAAAKLARKRVDLIVANDVSRPGAGFEHDTNEVRIMSPAGIDADRRPARQAGRRPCRPRRRRGPPRHALTADRHTPDQEHREQVDLHLGDRHRGPSRQDGRPDLRLDPRRHAGRGPR